jgi:hypothetical protein
MAGFGTVRRTSAPRRVPRPDPEHAPGAPAGVPRVARGRADALAGRGEARPGAPCTSPRRRWTPDRSWPKRHRARCATGDTEETLHERIKTVERTAVPRDGAEACVERLAATAGDGPGSSPEDAPMRALLSVYDKEGLIELAQGLAGPGLGAGGQRQHRGGAGRGRHRPPPGGRGHRAPPKCWAAGSRPCTRRSTAASWPTATSRAIWPTSSANGIEAIDLVVSNLYPFSSDPSIELIDIGGPSMVRSAAKNHAHVGIVTSPHDYAEVSWPSCARTARCPRPRVAGWPGRPSPTPRPMTRPSWAGSMRAALPRRRGDDEAALAVLPPTHPPDPRAADGRSATARTPTSAGPATAPPAAAELVGRGGPARSARSCPTSTSSTPTPPGAWSTSCPGRRRCPAVAIIKHANPCGAAVADDLVTAYERALECDRAVGLRGHRGHRRGGDRGAWPRPWPPGPRPT